MNSLGYNGPGGYTEIFMCQIWANSTLGDEPEEDEFSNELDRRRFLRRADRPGLGRLLGRVVGELRVQVRQRADLRTKAPAAGLQVLDG